VCCWTHPLSPTRAGGAAVAESVIRPLIRPGDEPVEGHGHVDIQRQLGHTNLGTTSIYLQGIDPEEIIATVRMRRAAMMSASAGLRL
jgi:integrase